MAPYYVIKNIVTKTYLSNSYGSTKDLFKAEVFTHKFVNKLKDLKGEVHLTSKECLNQSVLKKNERFVAIKISEA